MTLRTASMAAAMISCLCLVPGCGAPERPAPSRADAAEQQRVEPVPAPAPAPSQEWKRVVFVTPNGEYAVDVELARTDAERARGLMHREVLPVGKGMLFVFDEERDQSFWMKNTLIPLDMVFVQGAADGTNLEVVGVVREAVPRTLTPRSVGRLSRFVVEVIGGWTEVKGIEAGTRLRFE